MSSPYSRTRRDFLRTGVAISAAPLLIMSARAGAADVNPSDRITLGFIGMGKQARGLLGGFLNRPDTQVVAVCDVDTHRRDRGKQLTDAYYSKKTGTDYKGCDTYRDFRNLLARPDIDAVVIATPDHWHAITAIAAANAGKDIYCEKPLCETVHESQAMTRAVRANNRIFQVGSMQRSSKEFRNACEIVRQGRLGSISRVLTGFGSPGKPCDLPEDAREPGLDWDLWLGPAPDRPYSAVLSPRGVHENFPNWRLYWEYGGGMVTDWGAHHVDIAQWGLGMDQSGPVEVIPPEDWKTARAGGKLIYANGVELIHVPDGGVTFIGSEGELFVDRGKFKLTLNGKVLADNTVKPADPEEKTPGGNDIAERAGNELLGDTPRMLYVSDDHKADFLDAIKSRKDPICTVEVGAHSINACHLLNLGYRHGQKLKWDPSTEVFTGGTGNPKWLTREYRDPWRVA